MSIVGVEGKNTIIQDRVGVLSPGRGFFGTPLQKRIRFLKFRKFRIPKQTRLRTFVLLLQPSKKPLDQGTSMEFRIS